MRAYLFRAALVVALVTWAIVSLAHHNYTSGALGCVLLLLLGGTWLSPERFRNQIVGWMLVAVLAGSAFQAVLASIRILHDGEPLAVPLGISGLAGALVLGAGAVGAGVYVRRWNRIQATKLRNDDS